MMSQLSLARPVGSGVRVPGGLPPVAPGLAAAVSSCQSRVTVTGTDQLEYMILSGHCKPAMPRRRPESGSSSSCRIGLPENMIITTEIPRQITVSVDPSRKPSLRL